MNRTASTAFVALAACGGLVTAVSLLLAWLAPHVFKIPPDAVVETRSCIAVIGVFNCAAIRFFRFPRCLPPRSGTTFRT